MENPISEGIHHVTLITRDVQANVDFYVGFLGLRLVKRTGGYEDGGQLHLFYGDEAKGASVEHRSVAGGHELTAGDETIAQDWLRDGERERNA